MTYVRLVKSLLGTASLAAFLTAVPVHLTAKNGFAFGWSHAMADDGGEEGDGDGSGDDGGGDDDNGGSGGGGSGHGGSGDGNSGSTSGSSGGGSGDLRQPWYLLNDGTRVEIGNGGRDIKLFYANGWREEIRGGRYVLHDESDRLVVDRAVTDEDYTRLQGLLSA